MHNNFTDSYRSDKDNAEAIPSLKCEASSYMPLHWWVISKLEDTLMSLNFFRKSNPF